MSAKKNPRSELGLSKAVKITVKAINKLGTGKKGNAAGRKLN